MNREDAARMSGITVEEGIDLERRIENDPTVRSIAAEMEGCSPDELSGDWLMRALRSSIEHIDKIMDTRPLDRSVQNSELLSSPAGQSAVSVRLRLWWARPDLKVDWSRLT